MISVYIANITIHMFDIVEIGRNTVICTKERL